MSAVRRAALATLAALVLSACGGSSQAPAGELNGQQVDPPFEVSATTLENTDGEPFSLVDDTDRPLTLVFFAYTNCPDICGQVMATLAGTVSRLSDSEREQLDVVVVTADPARDTAEVLEAYVTRWDPSFVGVRGELDDLTEVGRSVGVGIEIPENPQGNYDVTHGTQVLAVDDNDQVPVYWSQDVSQAELAHDIKLLLDEG